MDTNKDDKMILIARDPNTTNTTQKNDIKEKILVGEKDSMPKKAHIDIDQIELNNSNEVTRDENISRRLMFLNKAKQKADVTLQVDTWLYNEIMALKKSVKYLHKNLCNETTKRFKLEGKIKDIP